MRRAALYHRVSTLEQDAAAARAELRAAALARGLEVVLEVEETGSGARNDRPGLRQVLEGARRHQFEVVLVWKLDRWGRSALDLTTNVQSLQRSGVAFVATSQGFEVRPGGDAISGLILQVLAGVAEFEREILVERTRLGMARARELGVHVGRPRGDAVDPARVVALREAGNSWEEVAEQLGCSSSAARRALEANSTATYVEND